MMMKAFVALGVGIAALLATPGTVARGALLTGDRDFGNRIPETPRGRRQAGDTHIRLLEPATPEDRKMVRLLPPQRSGDPVYILEVRERARSRR